MKLLLFIFSISLVNAGPDYSSLAKDPLELIHEKVQSHNIVVLGKAAHNSMSPEAILYEYLLKYGENEHLKYIVLERVGDSDEYYQRLSTEKGDSQKERVKFNICKWGNGSYRVDFMERYYVYRKIMPLIFKLNQKRKTPLLVRSVDGIDTTTKYKNDSSIKKTRTCQVRVKKHSWQAYRYAQSHTREEETAERFRNRIEANMNEDSKAIILYQAYHTVKNVEACRPYFTSPKKMSSKFDELSWWQRVARSTAFSHYSFLIEENTSNGRDHYGLSSKFSSYYKNKPLAYDFKNFFNHSLDREMDLTKFSQEFFSLMRVSGPVTLPELADGLIYLPYQIKESSKYLFSKLKNSCPPISY